MEPTEPGALAALGRVGGTGPAIGQGGREQVAAGGVDVPVSDLASGGGSWRSASCGPGPCSDTSVPAAPALTAVSSPSPDTAFDRCRGPCLVPERLAR